jgi:DeoR/GlpR family transcriptional regulator of sugar metabolism
MATHETIRKDLLTLKSHGLLRRHLCGQIHSASTGTVNSWALRHLQEVRTDVAFVGTNALR